MSENTDTSDEIFEQIRNMIVDCESEINKEANSPEIEALYQNAPEAIRIKIEDELAWFINGGSGESSSTGEAISTVSYGFLYDNACIRSQWEKEERIKQDVEQALEKQKASWKILKNRVENWKEHYTLEDQEV